MSEQLPNASEVDPRVQAEKQAIRMLQHAMDAPSFRPPMLPAVARQALDLSRNPNVDIRDMARLIETDQVLAARFLAVANSALYRRDMPALSVQAALTRLGLEVARDVVFFSAVEPFLFTSKRFNAETKRLRQHSMATSAACGYLAKFKNVAVEDASLAGLVHDLGAAAILKHIADNAKDYEPILREKDSLGSVLHQVHGVAGARVAQRWSLPEAIHEVIRDHHDVKDDSPLIVKMVAAADDLAARCGAVSGFEPLDGVGLPRLLEDPGLVTAAVEGFTERLTDLTNL